MEQNIRKRRALVVLLLTLGVILAAVLVTDRFSFRLDLSADGSNTLSKASRSLYKGIPEQVRLTYYVSRTLADRHPGPRAIEGMARSLSAASHGKILFEVVDPSVGKKESAVEALGVAPQRMQIVEKNEQRVALVYSGIVVQYLDRTQVLPFVISTDTLEYDLVKAVKAAVSSKKQVATILVGDQDKSLGNDFKTLSQALEQSGWDAREVRPGEEIPPDTTVLLVIGNDALEDYDAYRIDAYLASGGRALFAVKGVDVQVGQGLLARPLARDAVLRELSAYGVEVERNLVLDVSSLTAPFQVNSPFGGRAISYVRYPFWVMTRAENRNSKNPLTARLAGLDLFWPSPLELKTPAGVEAVALVKTTPKAWLQKDRFAIAPEDADQYSSQMGATAGQYDLAVYLSGALPMAYAGKSLPTRSGAAALPALPASPRPSRIIVVGSSDFANDLMAITDSTFNAAFIVSAADYLASGDELVSIKTRGLRDTRLGKVQDPDAKAAIVSLAYFVNLILVPLVVVAFGLVRSHNRKRLAKEEAMLRLEPRAPSSAEAPSGDEGGDGEEGGK